MPKSGNKEVHLHLVDTNSFIYETYDRFMSLNENVYYIVFGRSNRNFTDKVLALERVMPFETVDLKKILDSNDTLKVFIHFLNVDKVKWYNKSLNKYSKELYWIFYGADLHTPLERFNKVGYKSKEKKESIFNKIETKFMSILHSFHWRPVRKIIKEIDWFCFWNKYEYGLLKEHFETKSEFKYFRYFTGGNKVEYPKPSSYNPGRKIILINHSGSLTGNHLDLISKLDSIIENHHNFTLLIPLNYGNQDYIKKIKKAVKESSFEHFEFLEKRMPKEEYFAKLASATAALYGYYRQEGAGNINSLLNTNVQIFLSKNNSHGKHLIDYGYKISELESLKSENMIHKLTDQVTQQNRLLFQQEFSETAIKSVFSNLVKNG